MDKVVSVILISIFITAVYCIHSEKCNKLPNEKHCITEYVANTTFAYTDRYFYKNSTRTCASMRWSDNCSVPNDENNFESESDCMYLCPGNNSENCNKLPIDDKHCIIEYSANTAFAYTDRYYYDNSTKKCVLMRWSDNCSVPNDENNFESEEDCMYHCPGIPYQTCMKTPENKQCITNQPYRLYHEHSFRYYYNWDRRECVRINWLDSCGIPNSTANNFEDKQSCYDKCGIYA